MQPRGGPCQEPAGGAVPGGDLLAFRVRGWELVVADVPPGVIERAGSRVTARTPLGEGRFPGAACPQSQSLPVGPGGGRRQRRVAQPGCGTLEDFFVQQVSRRARGRSIGRRDGIVSAIAIVARGVFKESIRDRIPYNLVFFAVLLMAASLPARAGDGRTGRQDHQDLGLAAASAIGVFIAVFIGIGLRRKRSSGASTACWPSHRRSQFIVGSNSGLVLTLVVNLAVMAAPLSWCRVSGLTTPDNAARVWEASATDPRLLKAFVMIGVQLALITAVALFFRRSRARFSRPHSPPVRHRALRRRSQNPDALGASAMCRRCARRLLRHPQSGATQCLGRVVHAQPVTAQHMLLASASAG